jgi:phenylpyruvate tautomerase PptA (4-oxalocrotonate tautomerase family)
MPILEIEIVGSVEGHPNIARELADSAAEVLRTGPGHTWVKVRYLPAEQYAENGSLGGVQPVFVSVLQGRGGDSTEKGTTAASLVKAFAGILERPAENIHVLFEPDGIGRIAFGGQLREE